jgi:hypothetical protein
MTLSCRRLNTDLKKKKKKNSVTPDFFYMVVVCLSTLGVASDLTIIYLRKKDGQRVQYAPVPYPDLSTKVETFFKNTLAPALHEEVATTYRNKLCPLTQAQWSIASMPERKTPRFLPTIAAPDDKQHKCLEQSTGISAALKWDVVKQYTGPTADVLKSKPRPVH